MMTLSSHLSRRASPRYGALLALALIGVLLLTSLPAWPGAAPLPHPAAPPNTPAVESSAVQGEALAARLGPTAPLARHDPRGLPADLVGLPELTALRTAASATFLQPDGTLLAILRPEPIHYRDAEGAWAPLDPSFRADAEGYLVERNSLTVRAGLRDPAFAVGAGDVALNWRSFDLGYASDDGFVALARLEGEEPGAATQHLDGRGLRYANAWSDPRIAEELIAGPGQLKQQLVLSGPPAITGAPEHLILRADLALSPGATLWAAGEPVSSPLQTSGPLEVRGADGGPRLTLEPPLAFEQARPTVRIAGDYWIEPGAESGTYALYVRTPYAWWADPARSYPAVLDPTIRVQATTGEGGGLAWVGNAATPVPNKPNPDTTSDSMQLGRIVLGELLDHGPYKGYARFEDLPALINGPAGALFNISSATLIASATVDIPGYKPSHDMATYCSPLDLSCMAPYLAAKGDLKKRKTYSYDVELSWVTPGTTLADKSYALAPAGTPIGTAQLTVPGLAASGAEGTPAEWDVSSVLKGWYDDYYSSAELKPAGPLFKLEVQNDCPASAVVSTTQGPKGQQPGRWAQSTHVIACTRLFMHPGDVQLRIVYAPAALAPTPGGNPPSNILSRRGVPSVLDGVFAQSETDPSITTNHEYRLVGGSGQNWRAVAVRGNHALPPAEDDDPADVGLRLLRGSASPTQIAAVSGKPDVTSAIFLDHQSGAFAGAVLSVQVTGSQANTYAADRGRNYRINYAQAEPLQVQTGVWYTGMLFQRSDKLIKLSEFPMLDGQNALVVMRLLNEPDLEESGGPAPLSANYLLPTSGANGAIGSGSPNALPFISPPNDPLRLNFFLPQASGSGNHGLALINQERPRLPKPDSEEGDDPESDFADEVHIYSLELRVLRCDGGAIATAKYDCQPILLPTAPNQYQAQELPGLGVRVYSFSQNSSGDYFEQLPGGGWCVSPPSEGTPIIEPLSGPVSGRYIYVAQGKVCYDGARLYTTGDSGVGLTYQGPIPGRGVTAQLIYGSPVDVPESDPQGQTEIVAGNLRLTPVSALTLRNVTPFDSADPAVNDWAAFTVGETNWIDVATIEARGNAELNVPLSGEQDEAPIVASWEVDWRFFPYPSGSAVGYSFSPTVTPLTPLPTGGALTVAGQALRVLEGNTDTGRITSFDFVGGFSPRFYQLRGQQARITAAAALGGASRDVQAVLLPPGEKRKPLAQQPCSDPTGAEPAVACLDLRAPVTASPQGYTWAGDPTTEQIVPWRLPDLHITGEAGALQVATAGRLSIFSADHPAAVPSAISQSFSFDTWGVTVDVRTGPCDGKAEATIMAGKGFISLPMLGETSDPSRAVKVSFRLCDDTLSFAALSLDLPPSLGIPVGASGLSVHSLAGEVTIGASATEIAATAKFQSVDGALLQNGVGTIKLSTAGMFMIDGKADLIDPKLISAEGVVQIAWSPLDVLMDAETEAFGGIIGGAMQIHMWEGKGWQNKYPWLQSGRLYFSGSIDASVKVKKGALIDAWVLKVPPATLSFGGIGVQFGDFCQGKGCTTTAWGMSATASILGYKVGIYADGGGPEIILGSSKHVLADGAGLASLSGLVAPAAISANDPLKQVKLPGSTQPLAEPDYTTTLSQTQSFNSACPAAADQSRSCPLSFSGRALLMAIWSSGPLDVALVAPDGTLYRPGDPLPAGVTATLSETAQVQMAAFTVTTGAAEETWALRLDGVQELIDASGYPPSVVLAADPPAPEIAWKSPAAPKTAPEAGGTLNLAWTATRAGKPLAEQLPIELIYAPATSAGPPQGFSGSLIVATRPNSPQTPFADSGQFSWDTRGLASGEYYVGARVDDSRSGNGHVIAWAPGTVLVDNSAPPAAPSGPGPGGSLVAADTPNGVLLFWLRNKEPDLAGYLVSYRVPGWNGAPAQEWVLNVLPSGEDMKELLGIESVALGGLLPTVPTEVCVRAYDASGSLSPCANLSVTPTARPVRDLERPSSPPDYPGGLGLVMLADGRAPALGVFWGAPEGGPAPERYLVEFVPVGCRLPGAATSADQGAPPLVTSQLQYQLSGLTVGQRYRVAVRALKAPGLVGPELAGEIGFFLDTDADGDGLPDQWAEIFGVSGAGDDPDQDGLTNAQELAYGSFPTWADSDEDGFYDGEERAAGVPACGDSPASHSQPKLLAAGPATVVLTTAANLPTVAAEPIVLLNGGSGSLQWSAEASAPWLTLSARSGVGGDVLSIGANAAGLRPGRYRAEVVVRSGGGLAAAPETLRIPVELNVAPKAMLRLHLPIAAR